MLGEPSHNRLNTGEPTLSSSLSYWNFLGPFQDRPNFISESTWGSSPWAELWEYIKLVELFLFLFLFSVLPGLFWMDPTAIYLIALDSITTEHEPNGSLTWSWWLCGSCFLWWKSTSGVQVGEQRSEVSTKSGEKKKKKRLSSDVSKSLCIS